jgi:hypothetical protein
MSATGRDRLTPRSLPSAPKPVHPGCPSIGAEAVLKLRALRTNGDFDAYWRYHLHREHRRVHQARYAHPLARAA